MIRSSLRCKLGWTKPNHHYLTAWLVPKALHRPYIIMIRRHRQFQGARYCQHVHHPLRHCCSQHTYCVQGVCVGFCGQAAYCSIKIYVLWMGASTPRAEGLGVPREVQLLLMVWVCCILGVSAVGETRVRPHPRARLPRLLTFTAILQLPKDYCVQTCQPVLFG